MTKRWRTSFWMRKRPVPLAIRCLSPSWNHRHLVETSNLGQAEHQVHVLHGLAGSALSQVVDDRQHDQRVAAARALRRPMYGDTADIRSAHRTRIRMAASPHDVDERLVGVALLEKLLKIGFLADPRVERRVNATDKRSEVRHEHQPDFSSGGARQALPYLWPMAMPRHVVRHEIVRRFGEHEAELGLASGAAHA